MPNQALQRICNVCIPQRYILSIMCMFAMATTYIIRAILNFAITQMVTHRQDDGVGPQGQVSRHASSYCPGSVNGTAVTKSGGEFEWSEEQQGMILSAFYYGYIITHIPGGLLAQKFGGKQTIGIGIFFSAILTLLTPSVAYMGVWPLISLRFMIGLGEGVAFPSVSTLLSRWAPPLERNKLTSLCFAGTQLGFVTAAALGGVMLHYIAWPQVFYISGVIGVVWYILWCVLCYSEPSSHPYITDEEKHYILKAIGQTQGRKLASTPWGQMLKSRAMWALIIAQMGHDWCVYTMMTDLPKYMNDVLKFDIAQNGLLSSLPYLAMWTTSQLAGLVSDWILTRGCMTTTNLRKLMSTLSTVTPAVGVIMASYSGCDRALVIVLITAGMGAVGFYYAAVQVNPLDLSPNYSGSITAVVNGFGSLSGMLAPYILGMLTPNRSLVEWRKAFWLMFAVLCTTNLVFFLFGSGEVQPWNEPRSPDTEIQESKQTKKGVKA